MRIELKKFGSTLISRQAGAEALKALTPILKGFSQDENIEISFFGISTLAPAWGDEFLSPLLDQLGDRLVLLPSDNMSSVQATLKLLQEILKQSFNIR